VWALRDINFEVNDGDVLGIIGKNGAGKSTLLKILSRVTSPTTGSIKTKGRIASLLEVGTGFHPELTGRENIYLNGAILGMTKAEIKVKEEEIIDFSGCAMYIDTPVKRYSSGMRVRLAFAVAAHLEPDILVVDEVLAVGDAEFQKKAIGKMKDISGNDGRTVLFVSHNMAAVKSLCTRGIVLENGTSVFEGDTNEAVDFYLSNNNNINSQQTYLALDTDRSLFIKNIEFIPYSGQVLLGNKIKIKTTILSSQKSSINLHIGIYKASGEKLLHLSNIYDRSLQTINEEGQIILECVIPSLTLTAGSYYVNVSLHKDNVRYERLKEVVDFQIIEDDFYKLGKIPSSKESVYLINQNWIIE
jgi:lipopolysaccharide transport system ATP-binding protein